MRCGICAARSLAKPTADLLCASGQKPLRRLRLYASSGVRYDWDDHPESVVEEAIGYAEEGFTAYKMRLGTHWAWSAVTVDRFLKIAHQVHEAVGERMDLALDGNCRLSLEEALAHCRGTRRDGLGLV